MVGSRPLTVARTGAVHVRRVRHLCEDREVRVAALVLLCGCEQFLGFDQVSPPADAAPGTLVQHMAADTPSGDTLTVSLPAAPEKNDVLILIGSAENSVDGVPMGAGWQETASSLASPTIHVWYAVSDGTSSSASILSHSTGRIWLLLMDWHGISTSTTVDTNAGDGKAGGATDSGTISLAATTTAPDVVISSIACYGDIGDLAAPWIPIKPDAIADSITQRSWYQINDAPGPQSVTTTYTNEWDAVLVGFRLGQ